MPILSKFEVGSRQPLDPTASSRAGTPGRVSISPSERPQQPSQQGGVNRNIREVGGVPVSLLAAGNERPPAVRKCRADCLSCPDLSRENFCLSYITGRCHSLVNVESILVHCKWQNYIYLLSCNCCGVQYVGESIVPINDHYLNVCPDATFSIQILEKLEGNGYKNGKIDPEMRTYRKSREDMWMKLLQKIILWVGFHL